MPLGLKTASSKDAHTLKALEDFASLYSSLEKGEAKIESLKHLNSLLDASIKSTSQEVWKAWAHSFRSLNTRDQKAFLREIKKENLDKLNKLVFKILKIAKPKEINYFSPILLLAEGCLPAPLPLAPGSALTHQSIISPLYTTLLSLIPHKEGKLILHAILENALTKKVKLHPATLQSPLQERDALALRTGIKSYAFTDLFVACASTHPLIDIPGTTLKEDPYADDFAWTTFEKADCHVRLLSISDGGGKGDQAAKTARDVNLLFLEHASSKKIPAPHEIIPYLLSCVADTQIALREKEPGHATHASTVLIASQDELYGGVSLLGDCTAYLILEQRGRLTIEKLRPLEEDKLVSSCNGSFNHVGDFGSLYACQFEIPKDVDNALLLLGTDGFEDNLHPKNQLTPLYSQKMEEALAEPKLYYSRRVLENGRSLNEALLSPYEQKNREFLAETHRFPTPHALYSHLMEILPPEEKEGLQEPDKELPWSKWTEAPYFVQLYRAATLRHYYKPNPEVFIPPLAEHVRLQAKLDDILIAAIKIK